jgi:hypothetical protein
LLGILGSREESVVTLPRQGGVVARDALARLR